MLIGGLFSPLFAQSIPFYLDARPVQKKLCVAILVNEYDINKAFLDGVTVEYKKRLKTILGKKVSEIYLNVEYGYKGLMSCLNPYAKYERVFILSHSLEVDNQKSALVYFQKTKTLRGEELTPYKVENNLLVAIKKSYEDKPLFIATCYPEGLKAGYPELFQNNNSPEQNLETQGSPGNIEGQGQESEAKDNKALENILDQSSSNKVYLSEPDGAEPQIQSLSQEEVRSPHEGQRSQVLKLTSVKSALKLFAEFLDFR